MEIARRIQFCMGHRIAGHESKCAHLHGHNYVLWLHAEREDADAPLDSLGRIIDFSVLKSRFADWIETHWDHGFTFKAGDPVALAAIAASDPVYRNEKREQGDPAPWPLKTYALPLNPTAENLAGYILHVVGPEVLEGTGVRLVRVVLHETENCVAEMRLDSPWGVRMTGTES